MQDKRKLLKKTDLIIISLILIIAVGLYIFFNTNQKKGTTYQISVKGIVVKEGSLSKNETFSLDSNPAVSFEVLDSSVGFIHSDCPDKVCIETGFLSIGGQSAFCLPNNIALKIISDNDDALDGVVQ